MITRERRDGIERLAARFQVLFLDKREERA
jgi:hypothetical protein